MQRHAGEDGNNKKESGKAKAFDFINVVAEKNKKTGACANGKSRNSGTEAENAFSIKFRNDDGGSTVWNKSDHARNQRLEEAFAHHKARKGIFADGVDADFENEHNNEDERESGSGMEQGALEKSVVAFGMAMGMFFFHCFDFLFGDVEKTGFVNGKTRDHRKNELCSDERKNFSCVLRIGKKNGYGFIAGGDENREKSSGGDYSVGIKVRRNNGKTALRNNAQKCTDCGSGFSEF